MKREGSNASIGGNKYDWDLQDDLLQPSEVVIVDDTNAYQLFGDRIFCAPQDDIIESTQSSVFGLLCVTHCFIRTVSPPGLSKLEFSCQGRLHDVPGSPQIEDWCPN